MNLFAISIVSVGSFLEERRSHADRHTGTDILSWEYMVVIGLFQHNMFEYLKLNRTPPKQSNGQRSAPDPTLYRC